MYLPMWAIYLSVWLLGASNCFWLCLYIDGEGELEDVDYIIYTSTSVFWPIVLLCFLGYKIFIFCRNRYYIIT